MPRQLKKCPTWKARVELLAMGAEQRRDKRYPVKMPARLVQGHDIVHLLTEDVSFRGLFLRTDSPPRLRQLVRIEIDLPSKKQFSAHGMAVHVVEAPGTAGRVPGVGVQFYAVDREASAVWDEFVNSIKDSFATDAKKAEVLAPPNALDPIRRRFPRYRAPLEVRFRTIDDLYTAYARDVSKGGIFVTTERVLPAGTEVLLTIVRPDSEASFEVEGIVRRQVRTPALSGVGVEFCTRH